MQIKSNTNMTCQYFIAEMQLTEIKVQRNGNRKLQLNKSKNEYKNQ